ncbi:hypothetical protein MLD38_004765 [Melastoma candidum]|nr:hypothetical protein MLD38_004765 [Melastoma candidum]
MQCGIFVCFARQVWPGRRLPVCQSLGHPRSNVLAHVALVQGRTQIQHELLCPCPAISLVSRRLAKLASGTWRHIQLLLAYYAEAEAQ